MTARYVAGKPERPAFWLTATELRKAYAACRVDARSMKRARLGGRSVAGAGRAAARCERPGAAGSGIQWLMSSLSWSFRDTGYCMRENQALNSDRNVAIMAPHRSE